MRTVSGWSGLSLRSLEESCLCLLPSLCSSLQQKKVNSVPNRQSTAATRMLRWLPTFLLAPVLAANPDDVADASCMLQAHRSADAHQDVHDVLDMHQVCNGKQPNVLNFESFNHGDEIKPNSIQGAARGLMGT